MLKKGLFPASIYHQLDSTYIGKTYKKKILYVNYILITLKINRKCMA